MPCACGKKNPRVWRPRPEAPEAVAPEGATHRIVSSAERQAERENAIARPPRARQPQA